MEEASGVLGAIIHMAAAAGHDRPQTSGDSLGRWHQEAFSARRQHDCVCIAIERKHSVLVERLLDEEDFGSIWSCDAEPLDVSRDRIQMGVRDSFDDQPDRVFAPKG